MGPKDAPASTHRPRRLSHPPRPRSHFPRTAFRGPRRAIGIPQQQLSTMGYPRKSYPHRCPPPCAKRSRPRACACVYIIYRSPVGRSRGVSALLPKRVRAVVAPCPAPPCAGWGRAKAKADAPSHSNPPLPCVLPAPVCLPPRPRRLNGHPASAGGRENDRMAHRRTTTPTHRTQRGNDTCTIRVPRRKGAQSVVHNLYFSSSRPASFCTTFPQSCTDRPATYRKVHKSPPEGLIFRVLPPAFPTFCPKAIVQNPPAPPPFFPRKTPRFAPTRNRARTFASAGRDNTPRPAHSSRFQRDTDESPAHRKLIFAPPKAENGGVCGLKC